MQVAKGREGRGPTALWGEGKGKEGEGELEEGRIRLRREGGGLGEMGGHRGITARFVARAAIKLKSAWKKLISFLLPIYLIKH